MRIHLIKERTVFEYIELRPESEVGLKNWLRILNGSDWSKPSDILKSTNSADIIGKGTNRVVFNIGGNKIRCICTYSFGSTFVHLFINWIGTHKEYDNICDKELQYTTSIY